MSTYKNRVILIGNVGNKTALKKLESGKSVTRVALATNDYYKDGKGQHINETQWHNLVMWGKQAEQAERYLRIGAEVAVEGKLINRNYTDKDGIKRFFTEIVVSKFNLIGQLIN